MWLCVDRVEGDTVILVDDNAAVLSIPRTAYEALTGVPPLESDMLLVSMKDGEILSAAYDAEETRRRADLVRTRLNRLFGRPRT